MAKGTGASTVAEYSQPRADLGIVRTTTDVITVGGYRHSIPRDLIAEAARGGSSS